MRSKLFVAQVNEGSERAFVFRTVSNLVSKVFRSGFDHYLKAGATERRDIALGLSVLH